MGKIIIAQSNRGAPDPIGLHNISGSQINPATEDTLQDLLECLGCQSGTDILTEIQSILAQLDVALSTRASEATLLAIATDLALVKADIASIDASIDVNLSTRASEATLLAIQTLINSINTKLDVNLSTRASESTLVAVKDAVDGLEGQLTTIISRLDVDLSTRASELTLQAVLDALGEESGTNVLSELQDIDSTLNSGLDIRLHDKDGNGLTSTAISGGLRALDVNIVGGDYEFEVVGIKDSSNNRIDPAEEGTLQALLDTVGEESGETALSKLQDIIDALGALSIDDVGIRDSGDTRINPSTEETLEEVRDAIGQASGTNVVEELKSILAQLDVALSTRASESTLNSIYGQLDITLSALRDAIKGSGNKDFTTLEADVEAILAKLDVNLSTRASEVTVQNILNALGEESATNILEELQSILAQLDVALSTRASEATSQNILNAIGQISGTDVINELDAIGDRLDVDLSTVATEITLQSVLDALGEGSATDILTELQNLFNAIDSGIDVRVNDKDGNGITSVELSGGVRALDVNIADSTVLNVNITPPGESQTLQLVFDQLHTSVNNGEWQDLLSYTVPDGYDFNAVAFDANSGVANEAGRVVSEITHGTFVGTTDTFTSNSNPWILPKFGTKIYVYVTTATSAGGAPTDTVTITYTNQDGTTGRTATATVPKSSPVGTNIEATLQTGDYGVIDITNVTHSKTGSAGDFDLNTVMELFYLTITTQNVQYQASAVSLGGIVVGEGEEIRLQYLSSSAVTNPRRLALVGTLTPVVNGS